MNLNEIMAREISDAGLEARERPPLGDDCALPWGCIAVWIVALIAALGAAFTAGMKFQAERDLKADQQLAERLAE